MRLFIRAVLGLVALFAGALSFQSLMHLGELCGYGGLAWAYPLTLDLGAAASCAAWLHERNRQALAMTWAMIAISVVLNGTLHFLQTARVDPSWWLVVLVAAVPPSVFGLVVHLAVAGPAPSDDRGPAQSAPAVESRQAERAPEPTPRAAGKPSGMDTALVAKVRAYKAEHPDAGRPAIAREFNLTDYQARRALAATNGHRGGRPRNHVENDVVFPVTRVGTEKRP